MAFGRPIVVAGRLADERRTDEAVVDEELAERRHLRVGSSSGGDHTLQQFGPAGEGQFVSPQGAVVDLRVVGIVRTPRDLVPVATDQDNIFVNGGELYLTPAYWARYGTTSPATGSAWRTRCSQVDLPRLRGPAPPVRRSGSGGGCGRADHCRDDHLRDPKGHPWSRSRWPDSRSWPPSPPCCWPDPGPPDRPGGGRVPNPAGAWHDPSTAGRGGRGPAAPIAVAGGALAVARGAVALSPATPLQVARRAERPWGCRRPAGFGRRRGHPGRGRAGLCRRGRLAGCRRTRAPGECGGRRC